jgi:hypothetical protein
MGETLEVKLRLIAYTERPEGLLIADVRLAIGL